MTTSLRRSSGPVLGFAAGSNYCSSTSSFSSRSYARLYGSMPSSPSVRNSVPNLSASPQQFIYAPKRKKTPPLSIVPQKKACICSPSNHPGSFRCSLHKVTSSSSSLPVLSHKINNRINQEAPKQIIRDTAKPLNQLDTVMSDVEKAIVGKRTAQVELVERALNRSIGYSSDSNEHRPRHARFQPRPSKLSVMSKA